MASSFFAQFAHVFQDGTSVVDGLVDIPLSGQTLGCLPSSNGGRSARLLLRHFLAGPENRLVEVAVRSVLVDRPSRYTPLLLCGPPGSGKSHISRGIAAQWRACNPRSRVVCTSAAAFARDLTDAIETHALDDLRAQYREADLLVLEDIGELAGNPAAQEELLHALDVLFAEGRQVVLTAPAELPGLTPALRSRLSSGLTVPLSLPGPDTRCVLLERLAKLHRIKLSRPAAQILAEGLDVPVQTLYAAVRQLALLARHDGCAIDADAARVYLARRSGPCRPQLSEIAATTAQLFSLKLSDLRGRRRRRAVVGARGVAMYLARRLTGKSFQQIGQYFGGRDHTTVMHACRKTENRLKSDPAIFRAVEALQQRWKAIETQEDVRYR